MAETQTPTTPTPAQYWQLRALMGDEARLQQQLAALNQKRAQLFGEMGLRLDGKYILDDETCSVTPQ